MVVSSLYCVYCIMIYLLGNDSLPLGRRGDLVGVAQGLELGASLPEETEPLAAVFSTGVIHGSKPSLVPAQQEFGHVGLAQKKVNHFVRSVRRPKGIVQWCAFVIVSNGSDRETDFFYQKLDHPQVSTTAGNVQNGFSESVAGIAAVGEDSFLVQFLGLFEIVVANGIEDFRVVGVYHGLCGGRHTACTVGNDLIEIAETVGPEGGLDVIGGVQVIDDLHLGFDGRGRSG